MPQKIINPIKTTFLLLIVLILLTGVVYPVIITGIAQIFFPRTANGTLLEKNGKLIGSFWIGQYFSEPKYFCGRPSATLPYPYNAEFSSGSNRGPSAPIFLQTIQQRIDRLKKDNPEADQHFIPIDLVTASGSGLDPDISVAAATYQVARIAKIRGIVPHDLLNLIERATQQSAWGILSEPYVNVLTLNLALDQLSSTQKKDIT